MIRVGSFVYLQDEKGEWFYKSINPSLLKKKVKIEKEEKKDPIPFKVIEDLENDFKIDYQESLGDMTKEIATYLVSLNKSS